MRGRLPGVTADFVSRLFKVKLAAHQIIHDEVQAVRRLGMLEEDDLLVVFTNADNRSSHCCRVLATGSHPPAAALTRSKRLSPPNRGLGPTGNSQD